MDSLNGADSEKPGPQSRPLLLIAAFLAVSLQIILFMLVALRLPTDDDQMYAAAPYLWQGPSTLYVDIPFLQMPYIAVLYRGIAALTGTGYYSAIVWTNLFMTVLAAWLFGWCAQRLSKNNAMAGMLTFSAILSCTSIFFNAATLGNHAPLLLLAAFLTWVLIKQASTPRRALAAGAIVGLATGFKLSGISLGLPLLWWLLFPLTRSVRVWLMAALGLLAALAPLLLFIWPDPERFWQMNVSFHLAATALRGGGVGEALANSLTVLFKGPGLLLLPVLLLSVPTVRQQAGLGLLLALFVAGLCTSVLPGVTFFVHAGIMQAMACLIVVTLISLRINEVEWGFSPRTLLTVFLLVQAGYGMSQGWQGLVETESKGYARWPDQLALQREFSNIAAMSPCARQVVTLAPIPALTTGLPLHPLGGAGAFLVNLYPDPATAPAALSSWVDVSAALNDKSIYLTGVLPPLAGEAGALAQAKDLGLKPHVIGRLRDFDTPREVVAYLPSCD